MSATTPANRGEGISLRQTALIAGFAYLLSPVTTAEFSIMPKLVIDRINVQTSSRTLLFSKTS
jgi:hypothetical protein